MAISRRRAPTVAARGSSTAATRATSDAGTPRRPCADSPVKSLARSARSRSMEPDVSTFCSMARPRTATAVPELIAGCLQPRSRQTAGCSSSVTAGGVDRRDPRVHAGRQHVSPRQWSPRQWPPPPRGGPASAAPAPAGRSVPPAWGRSALRASTADTARHPRWHLSHRLVLLGQPCRGMSVQV